MTRSNIPGNGGADRRDSMLKLRPSTHILGHLNLARDGVRASTVSHRRGNGDRASGLRPTGARGSEEPPAARGVPGEDLDEHDPLHQTAELPDHFRTR